MTQDEFITWLEGFLEEALPSDEPEYLKWIITKRLASVQKETSHPFCGRPWNAGSFDYYWTPNDYE